MPWRVAAAANRVLVYGRKSGQALVWDVANNHTGSLLQFGGRSTRLPSTPQEYVAALVRARSLATWTCGALRRKQVKSTSLTNNHQTGQAPWTGSLSFTAAGSAAAPDEPVLLIQASGTQTEVSRWDVLNSPPTLLGSDGYQWRQVYDAADLRTDASATDEPGASLIAVAGDKSVTIFDDDGTLQAQTAAAHDWITAVETTRRTPRSSRSPGSRGTSSSTGPTSTRPSRCGHFRGHRGSVNALSFSADGRHLVTAGADGTVRVWRLPQTDVEWHVSDWILGARYAPGGRYLFGYSPLDGGNVTRGDDEGNLAYEQANLAGQLSGMDPGPDGDRAVVVEERCHVPAQVSVVESAKVVTLDKPDDGSSCAAAAAWNPDSGSHQIVAGMDDGELVSWDADSGRVTDSVDLGDGVTRVVSVSISGDGTTVVAGTVNGEDRQIHVLDAGDLSDVVATWSTSGVRTLDVSADGRYVVSGGGDRGQVTVWDVEERGQVGHTLSQLRGTLDQVTVQP